LEDLRRELPRPEDIPEGEVRDYYAQHRADFVEPERRRVLVIELAEEKIAAKLAQESQGASGEKWAELARKHSLARDRLGPTDASELAGDRGFVSAPGEKRGENANVPVEVRRAVFGLKQVGDVAEAPAVGDGRYYSYADQDTLNR